MTTNAETPFHQDPTRNHREQSIQDPRDNLMYGVRDMDDVDVFGNHHDQYEEYLQSEDRPVSPEIEVTDAD